MITNLEPDIPKCEVKRALGSITNNKASEGNGILVELFQILKDDAVLQKNIYFCFIDYAKTFDCMDHSKLWKILKKMGIPDHLTCLLRNLYAGQEAAELDMEQQTGSKLEKEYIKAVYVTLLI